MTDHPAACRTAPLSFQQEETVRNIRQYPDCVLRYDAVRLYRLDGRVDVDCLVGAVEDLVDRHAALRTVLAAEGDGYVQRIHPGPVAPVTVARRPGVTPEDVGRLLMEARYTPDQVLAGAPLFRPAIHQLDDTVLLSFLVHHLVYDGWSLPVLFRDVSLLYRARLTGEPTGLPELPESYADFAEAQRTIWRERGQQAVAFYRPRLADCPKTVKWPMPLHPPAVSSPRAIASIPFSLDQGVSGTVRKVARSARVSPFLVLLCAVAVAVFRVTGERNLLFAPDNANRAEPHRWDTVGHYVNSKLVRVQVEQGQRFADLLRSVWSDWLAADAHQDVYVDQILQELGGPRPIKVNMFNYPVGDHETPQLPNVDISTVRESTVSGEGERRDWRDFTVFWEELDRTYHGVVLYRPAHVDLMAAEGVVDHVRQVCAQPDAVV